MWYRTDILLISAPHYQYAPECRDSKLFNSHFIQSYSYVHSVANMGWFRVSGQGQTSKNHTLKIPPGLTWLYHRKPFISHRKKESRKQKESPRKCILYTKDNYDKYHTFYKARMRSLMWQGTAEIESNSLADNTEKNGAFKVWTM